MEGEKANESKWFRNGIFLFYEFDCDKVEKAASNDSVSGKCTLCLISKAAIISGRVRVSSNFLKHLKVK